MLTLTAANNDLANEQPDCGECQSKSGVNRVSVHLSGPNERERVCVARSMARIAGTSASTSLTARDTLAFVNKRAPIPAHMRDIGRRTTGTWKKLAATDNYSSQQTFTYTIHRANTSWRSNTG